MDMFTTDETRPVWLLRVERLIDGEITWDEFSNSVVDELDLEPNAQASGTGPGICFHAIIFVGHTIT
jgi:hypothetical protein